MILLDTPEGALQFAEIYHQAQRIVSYCLEYKVPLAQGLEDFESLEGKLRTALNMLIKNNRVEKIGALIIVISSMRLKKTVDQSYFILRIQSCTTLSFRI